MITKILKEMQPVRENKDYKNYRNLSTILTQYINTNFPTINYSYNYEKSLITSEQKTYINNIKNDIQNEIDIIQNLLDVSLLNKNYGDLKMLAQVDITLKQSLTQINNYVNVCFKNDKVNTDIDEISNKVMDKITSTMSKYKI